MSDTTKELTMLKDVFRASSPQGLRFSIRTLLGWLSDSSLAGLEVKRNELFTKVTRILGREPTESEFRDGIPKPEPSQEQIAESRQAKVRADHNRRMEAEAAHNPEAIRLRVARERAEEERVAGLSPVARELELATRAAQEAEQRKADQQRRAEIKATPAYQTLRQGINDSILVAKLDPSISQEQLDALVNQSEALDRTADVAAVRANLVTVQKSIAGEIELRDAELMQAVSRAELRKKMLSAGQVWDDVGVEMLGETEYVSLTVGTETKRVTKATYDARQSDEQLKAQLFSGETTNA